MKCETCMNSRPVLSENGWHDLCALPSIDAIYCMTGREDNYVPNPHKEGVDND